MAHSVKKTLDRLSALEAKVVDTLCFAEYELKAAVERDELDFYEAMAEHERTVRPLQRLARTISLRKRWFRAE